MEETIPVNQDIGNRFRIKWQNMDRYGFGKSRDTYTRSEANKLARELNREHPKILHTVEPV